MISIKNNVDCCGCNACGDVCPKGSITFQVDHEGFWYPVVDMATCIDCKLCENVCPILTKADNIKRYKAPKVYAAYSKDENVRIDSTSGGIHSTLANYIYSQGGYVGGAVYNKDFTVSHVVSDDRSLLPEIRSSKYIQSSMEGQYKEVKRLLDEGEKVFYCAAPCQIQALYKYLKHDYDNLVTSDFICRGVNSPKVFLSYLNMLERQYGAKVTRVKFKAKKWGWHNFSLRVNFENGNEYCKDREHDLFFIGYLQYGNFARPSCYECSFKGFPQKADITLGDFWGIEKLDVSLDNDKGTSLVMVNSEKGRQLLESIENNIVSREFSMEDALKGNGAMKSSLQTSYPTRVEFFNALDNYPFDMVAKKYFPMPSIRTTLKKVLMERLRKYYYFFMDVLELKGIRCWKNFLFWNYLSCKVQGGGRVIPMKNTIIQIDSHSKLNISGRLKIGSKQVKRSKMETRILIEKNAEMVVHSSFTVYAGSYIRVISGGKLILNSGFLNENVQITCGDQIFIGEGCAIARDVVIRSYDGHHMESDDYEISKPIVIGRHVWIGQGATILKGVTVGDGAIIAAGAIVTKDVPERTLVAGIPAKIIRNNVSWR